MLGSLMVWYGKHKRVKKRWKWMKKIKKPGETHPTTPGAMWYQISLF
jgi:hypothetical protein